MSMATVSQHPSFQRLVFDHSDSNAFHLRGQASAKGFTDQAHQKVAEIQKKLGKSSQVSPPVGENPSKAPKARAKRAAKRVIKSKN